MFNGLKAINSYIYPMGPTGDIMCPIYLMIWHYITEDVKIFSLPTTGTGSLGMDPSCGLPIFDKYLMDMYDYYRGGKLLSRNKQENVGF